MENTQHSTKIQELKAKGRKILEIQCGTYLFHFKQPNFLELSYFQDQIHTQNSGHSSIQDKFLRSLFIGENIVEFDQYLKDKPLVISNLLYTLCENLGGEENFSLKEI